MITPDEIKDARARLEAVIARTPVEVSDTLTRLLERPVLLKHEERQRTGSFKIRGAYNLVSRVEPGVEVVAASAGNHAQGVARAAALTGHTATIFMPEATPLPKVAATRADGADVRLEGDVVDESLAAGKAYAAERGATWVHPFDDPLVIAGQGTIGLEMAEECEPDATVLVPVGGGGLIAGIATALKAARPAMRVVGVEAEGAAAVRASLDAGEAVALDHVSTIADGIAVKATSPLALEHVAAHVDDVVTVTDDEIGAALIVLLERAKAVVEPAGAVGLAAVMAGKVPGDGPVLVLLSGGNVDPVLLIHLIEHGLTAAGRYLLLRIVLDDRPGQLADLTRAVAGMGLNVLSVEHHRVGLALGVDKVEVTLTVETRDPSHRDEALRALHDAGFAAELIGR